MAKFKKFETGLSGLQARMGVPKRKSFSAALTQLHDEFGIERRRVNKVQRKLNELQPGQIILLGTRKQKKTVGRDSFEISKRALAKGLGIKQKKQQRGLKNSMTISFGAAVEWGFDMDVRKLVRDYIQLPLAVHFRNQLLRGRKPTSEHKHPDVAESTARHWKRSRGGYGVRTGWMAHNWLVFPVHGSFKNAKAILKPNGADYRNQMITRALRDNVDFQGVTGSAAAVIEKGLGAWMQDMQVVGKGVATPTKVDAGRKGTLSEFIGGPHQGPPADTRKFRHKKEE